MTPSPVSMLLKSLGFAWNEPIACLRLKRILSKNMVDKSLITSMYKLIESSLKIHPSCVKNVLIEFSRGKPDDELNGILNPFRRYVTRVT